MILYYTYKQKTKVFANAVSDVLNLPVYELITDLNNKSDFGFIFRALKLTFTGKACPINNMPESVPSEIYVCSPIWGGRVAAPVKYFLENMNLQGTRINLILTASSPTEKYKQNAEAYLRKISCIPGDVYLFLTSDKFMPDREVLAEQLRGVLA